MNLKKLQPSPENYQDWTVYPLEGIWDISEEAKLNSDTLLDKDELVFDLHESEAKELTPKIIEIMEGALKLPHDTPVEVTAGTGDNWLQAH